MKTFPTSLLSLERIFSISHEITANPSFDDILHSIVVVATELVDCEGASIYLSDATTNSLSFATTTYEKLRLLNISVPIDQSIAGAAFTGDSPVIVNDVQQDPQYYHYPKADELTGFTTRSILAVPLTFREHKIGVIQVLNKKQGQFDEADVDLLVILAAQATITIEIARSYNQAQEEIARRMKMEEELRHYQDHLEELVKERTAEVHRLVTTDPLTGLFNRGHFMTLGDRVMRRAYQERLPVSGMMIDIDRFKTINETYGHEMGDVVLKRLASLIQETFPPASEDASPIIGRYMGEEFVVLLPNTGLQAACDQAERLLKAIRALAFDTDQGPFGFTASIGLVEMAPGHQQSLGSLINLTEQALAAAKQAGRDQVFVGNILIEVQRMATTDALTGLFVRAYWMLLANKALLEAQRSQVPFSAMIIDGDHFKNVNDTYGHAVGDEAVRKMSAALRQSLRSSDIIGRYGGGDEFIVFMPNTRLQPAYKLAERLLHQVREMRFDSPQGPFSLTVSIGVVEMDPDRTQTLQELINAADAAQYTAKRAGRNQVSMGEPGA
jgi:diguanylate cyclase (GGDEF)-like protein